MAREQLGEYLVAHGAIEDRELDKALEAQADAHHSTLGEVLVELDVVSAELLERVVYFGIEQLGYEPPLETRALRGLLLEHGLASRCELDAAEASLDARRRTRIGEVLVEMNAIDRNTLASALVAQRNPGSGVDPARGARRIEPSGPPGGRRAPR